MKRIGIFGGTFNPVHCGHLNLAQWLVDEKFFDEVWLTLSPENPLKSDRPGASDSNRREMLNLACEGREHLHPCFIEFNLPRPSYTINTLQSLSARFPDYQFSLIIGSDNWKIFPNWHEPDAIRTRYGVVVYPRPGYDAPETLPDGVRYVADAPQSSVSSSAIRSGQNLNLLPQRVLDYIKEHHLYD